MSWQLDKNRAICPQICERLCVEIANGTLKPNDKLASVRELAIRAGVNPNTVQKAFEQLEQDELIYVSPEVSLKRTVNFSSPFSEQVSR